MNEIIYNQWHFPRIELAESYLNLLTKGSGDPIALQCPRRWGKTTFLLNEMKQTAADAGFYCVYIDIWQNRSDVLGAINYGLQEAIDDLEVPRTVIGKRLKTQIKKVAGASFAVDFGDEPSRRRPDAPHLLVDWLLKTLARRAAKPLFLMFDEIQEVAVSSDGENIVSALRAAITKSKDSVRVVFTGSNQERLAELFSKSRAALYEGANVMAFPRLGDDFIGFVSQQAMRIFRRRIPESALHDAFERFQYQPRAIVDLVFYFASSQYETFSEVLNERIEETLQADVAQPQFDMLTPLQRVIATRLAAGGDVSSLEARRRYADSLKRKTVSPGSINNALKALVQKHIISKPVGSHGGYTFDDPTFREWLRLSPRPFAHHAASISKLLRSEDTSEDSVLDRLTGVHNRRYFSRFLKQYLAHPQTGTVPVTVILLDVDDLKAINNLNGHAVGDHVLKAIANIVRPLLRSNDVFSRYGGDEFAILLEDTPAAQGLSVAEKICADIGRSPVVVLKTRHHVTVSCGVATTTSEYRHGADSVVANADEALYQAKAEGRNRAVLYQQR
jgi:diguanylate cyclase (GGDEF)-like protein